MSQDIYFYRRPEISIEIAEWVPPGEWDDSETYERDAPDAHVLYSSWVDDPGSQVELRRKKVFDLTAALLRNEESFAGGGTEWMEKFFAHVNLDNCAPSFYNFDAYGIPTDFIKESPYHVRDPKKETFIMVDDRAWAAIVKMLRCQVAELAGGDGGDEKALKAIGRIYRDIVKLKSLFLDDKLFMAVF